MQLVEIEVGSVSLDQWGATKPEEEGSDIKKLKKMSVFIFLFLVCKWL